MKQGVFVAAETELMVVIKASAMAEAEGKVEHLQDGPAATAKVPKRLTAQAVGGSRWRHEATWAMVAAASCVAMVAVATEAAKMKGLHQRPWFVSQGALSRRRRPVHTRHGRLQRTNRRGKLREDSSVAE
jgi:hypothetical protein